MKIPRLALCAGLVCTSVIGATSATFAQPVLLTCTIAQPPMTLGVAIDYSAQTVSVTNLDHGEKFADAKGNTIFSAQITPTLISWNIGFGGGPSDFALNRLTGQLNEHAHAPAGIPDGVHDYKCEVGLPKPKF